MKKNTSTIKQLSLIAIICTVIISAISTVGCNKKFDTPPLESTDTPTVTMSISQLKALHTTKGSFQTISTSDVISGVVTANDSSGNFYQEIVIQDNTGAIPVEINAASLYNDYPVGRKVFIKVKGLILGDYGGAIQLGGGIYTGGTTPSVDGIASTLVDSSIVGGSYGNTVVPLKISDLTMIDTSMQSPLSSALVTLDSFEFASGDLNSRYADSSKTKSTVYYYLENCAGQTVELYNSSFAYFAGIKVPQGRGPITGIYTKFNAIREILIRDTNDIKFYGARCGGGSTGPATPTSIAALRALYTKDMSVGGNYTVGGTVISDVANKNISNGSFVLQSGNYGISVYAGGTIKYNVGDSVVLTLSSADSLINYAGSLELKLKSSSLPNALTATTAVVPVVKTIAQVNTALALPLKDPGNFEFTLIQIKAATVATGVYNDGTSGTSGNHDLTDASGKLTLYTAKAATFASATMPTASQDWICYPSNFNTTREVSIRNTSDVTASTGGGTTTPPTGDGINLGTTSPLALSFDDIGTALPQGVLVYTGATSTSLGTVGTLTNAAASWTATGVGFKNFASYNGTGLTSVSSQTDQNAATNRAFGVRQTSTTGYDPGASFVFELSNTLGKSNLKLDFLLQSLDGVTAAGRATVWTVDYGIGDSPTTFTTLTTSPAVLTTTLGTFANTPVHIDLPSALNNNSSKVWIRISALAASTGSGSRASTAIDDFKISW